MRVVFFLLFALFVFPAQAEIIVETPGEFRRAVNNAKSGETITMRAGTYDVTDMKIRRDLTIAGDGEVTLMSSRPVAKGLLNPVRGVSLTVEGLRFKGARSPDKNGAGIRHDGANLTIINTHFVENENGVLATGATDGRIVISDSVFQDNGHGDGYSHGIYVVRAKSLEISESRFVGTRIGHHVKSLAFNTTVTNSTLDDGDGRGSYAVDVSKGGAVTLSGNTIIESADSSNPTIVNYDIKRGGTAVSLKIIGNRIINRRHGGRLLRNPTGVAPEIYDNEIINEKGARLDYQETPKPELAPSTEEAVPAVPLKGSGPVDIPETVIPATLEQLPPLSPQRSGIIDAPSFEDGTGALARFKLQNNWKQKSVEDYVTFGLAFVPGAIKPGENIAAISGVATLPAQLDVKALHDDGSVRHGIVTFKAPELTAGEEIEARIVKSTNAGPQKFDAVESIKTRYSLPVSLRFYFSDDTTEDVLVDLRDAAVTAFAEPSTAWLNGAAVEERRVEVTVAPHLRLRADIRVYADGDIRTSLAFINDNSFAPGRRDMVYDVTIGPMAAPSFQASKVPHHRASNWRRVFWTGSQSRHHVIHDLQGLVASRAVLPFDASLGVDAKGIAQNFQRLKDDLPPLSPALIQPHFPRTGGRSDIGIVPTWTANYLVSQTQAAQKVMLINADAAGAVPWHYSDDETGTPISIENYPKFWADQRGLQSQYGNDRPHADVFASSAGGWRIDHAHKPALTAVPWLVTGDRYYADELAMQAAWAVFGVYPVWRDGGLKVVDVGQVRSSAWSLRDLSDAAFLLPDTHPSKEYLNRVLQQNLKLMQDKYITQRAMKPAGALEGFVEEHVGRNPERISPWQNDYLALSLWLSAHRGAKEANALLSWMSGFNAGRFLHPAFNKNYATAGVLPAKTPSGDGFVAGWAELSAKTKAGLKSEPAGFLSFPALADGHIGAAGAALSAIGSGDGHPDAFAALGVWLHETRSYPMWQTASRGDVYRRNGFFFELSAPNGGVYPRRSIQWNGKGNIGDDLVLSSAKGKPVTGGNGDDLLLGLVGDDQLTGGGGDDMLSGGGGSDVLNGGEGRDIFSLSSSLAGDVIVEDFDPQTDKVYFAGEHRFEETNEGLKIVSPGNRGSFLLKNVARSDLNEMNFRQFESTYMH